jgi:hypothetical protein
MDARPPVIVAVLIARRALPGSPGATCRAAACDPPAVRGVDDGAPEARSLREAR